MLLKDTDNFKGIFSVAVYDNNNMLVYTYSDKNLIVDKARLNMSKVIGNSLSTFYVNSIGFGIGTNAADPADLSLTGSISKSFDSITYPDTHSVSFNWSLQYNEANGMQITEFGLFANNGDLFARKVRSAIVKDSGFRLEGTWTIIF